MRIKLATSSPLPTFNCWFAINDKQEKQTIHQLRKKITKDLELKSEASNIQLLMDGFNLLPQTIIKDLVRDGDLITVKEDKSVKPIEKKRKISSTTEEKRDIETPVTKKAKKSKDTKDKKSTKDTTTKQSKDSKEKAPKKLKDIKEKAPKKSKDVKEKSAKKPKDSKEESIEEPKTKKSKRVEVVQQEDITPPASKKQKPLPFEGLPKTKKRNMRRRLLNKQLKNAAEVNKTTVAIESNNKVIDPELQVQNLTISNVEPLQLIKKNKNKKKNYMKQMEQRSHVHYTPEVVEEQPIHIVEEQPVVEKTVPAAPTTPVSKNPFGRAFVTYVETERNYKGRNNISKCPPHEYPIHRVPTLFYADQGLAQEEMAYRQQPEPVVEEQEAPIQAPVDKKEQEVQPEPEKPINYEQDFPEADFTKNIPSIGDKLAIKTLELTAAYTPEISEWKQVILKEFDNTNSQITIEYLPGFGKVTTKGGKFDIRKKKKRYDDEWYEEEIEEEEEEEEEVQVTMSVTDIFAMRNMSS